MFFDPEVDIAMDGLRKNCRLAYTGDGHYDVISPRRVFGYKKIADVDILPNMDKVRISNLEEAMYDFQKDELMDEARTDWFSRH